MSALQRTGALVAVAIGGLLAGRLLATPEPAPPEPVRPIVRTTTTPPVPAPRIDRAVIREELRAALAEMQTNAPQDAPVAVAPPAEPTPPQIEAARTGETLVTGAIARRRWQATDAERLREVLAVMSPEQRHTTLDALAAAVNRGEIVPDGPMLF